MRPRELSLLILVAALARPVNGRASVDVPCDFSTGLIRLGVTAKGGGQPLQFLLDSGASQSVIDRACARRLGFKTGSPRAVLGVNWQGLASSVSGFDGQLAGMPLPRSMLAIDLKGITTSGARIDGIVGLDFIRQYVVQLDYANRRVRFFRGGEYHPRGERFSLTSRNGALCIRAVVNGMPRLLRLDTGCNSDIECVEPIAARLSQGEPSVALQTKPGLRVTPAHLALGNQDVPGIESGWHGRRFFPGEDGLLGNGVLSRFTVTVDAAGRWIYLAKR